MFDALVSRGWMQPFGWGRPRLGEMAHFDYAFPRFDVIDRDKEIIVKAELPGVKKDDLEITLIDNILTIKGETLSEEKEEEGEFFRSEITRGKFSRSITLPSDVDVDKATTMFKGGLLTLKLPKLAVSKRRRIAVS
jgi:HSP20 family protein